MTRVDSGEILLAASQTIRDATTAVVSTPKPPAPKRPLSKLPADAVAFAGKHYKIFTEWLTWHDAKARCEALGGHLCIVRSVAENQFLATQLKAHNLHLAYIGATDEKTKGEWLWIDGTRVDYSNWAPSQPNNFRGIEHYAAIMGEYLGQWHDGQWHDQPDQSDVFPGFICQWD